MSEPAPAPAPKNSFWKPFIAGGCLGVALGMILLVGGLLVAYNFFFVTSVTKMAEAKDLRQVQFFADYDWTLTRLDGPELDLQSLKGRPVFLHLWRPECVSCVAEVRGINMLFQEYDGKGVAFVSVALDPDKDVAVTLAQHDVWFPVYTEATKKLPPAFAATSTPTTYILDKAGYIVYHHAGAVEWDSPDARAFLDHLLEQ